ncbi:hypothetical protein ACLQ2E_21920 [Streptomyces lavendulocolor]
MSVADQRLNFILSARDQISRVLDRAGDSAAFMARRMERAADDSSRAMERMERDTDGRLRDMSGRFASETSVAAQAVEQVTGALISLAPAAIPALASFAPMAASAGAAGVAMAAYGAALGPQISAMGDAAEAEQKLTDAVEEHGAGSKEASEAQAEYARQMAKLPAPTREAAVALSLLKDTHKEWSDSLAGDTMAPITKGMAVMGALLPKLTPMARSFGTQLDRVVTVAGGAVSTPGFDRLMTRFGEFTDRTLTTATTRLIGFLDRLDSGEIGGSVSEFMDYAREQGPVVSDTLRNLGQAVVNLLRGGSEVGVGMLTLVNALSSLVAAVPPGAIATFLQLAVALKAVQLAATGMAAARAAMVGFGVATVAMQTAAAAATTRLGALTAAFGAMSRGARLAVAGTGIGLLLIALNELTQRVRPAPPDVDKLTTSLKELAATGRMTGELQATFKNFDGVTDKLRKFREEAEKFKAANEGGAIFDFEIPVLDDIGDWFGDLANDVAKGEESFNALKGDLEGVDSALAQLAAGGHATQAAAAFTMFEAAGRKAGMSTREMNDLFPQYRQALASIRAEQQLAAQSMGLFGQQALDVKAKLDAQKQSTDGLRQSIHALNNAQLMARGGLRGMEAAIDAATEALNTNGRTLDITTEKGRANQQALDDLAGATMKAAESARENGASWTTVNQIYDKGRGKLIEVAQQMGLNRQQAAALAAQILRTPDKTARLRGNIEDLQKKLNNAKAQLARVPDSRKAAVRAQISQLEAALASARRQLAAMDGRSATTYVTTHYRITGNPNVPNGTYYGSTAGRSATGGLIRGPGTGTSDSIPWLVSNGEFVVRSAVVGQPGVLPALEALNRDGVLPLSAPSPGRSAGVAGGAGTTVVQVTVNGALDPMAVGRQIETVLEKYRRNKGGGALTFVK